MRHRWGSSWSICRWAAASRRGHAQPALLAHQPLPESGVIVASGGNAGIATAAAARYLGVPCEVFVPEVSAEAKRVRLRTLGAQVVVTGASCAEALEACLAHQRDSGALLTHAYDQPEVVAGAATLAR